MITKNVKLIQPNTMYKNYKQVQKKAGLNLKENSSGQHKGKTTITKRGRPSLRQLMYQIALVSVCL
ncbi:transposase [Syntrophothermus lipocalidus]|uniref:transposase n=1 Tax=Syntrophothermus lipocalidus TaxID=86170 RepID=UPI0002DF2283